MPITIPERLPAAEALRKENIFLMKEQRAKTQDIRPLRIVILNLMPKKIETETQLLRVLSNTPLQLEMDLIDVYKRQAKPLGPNTAPGCDEPTSRCQTSPSMWTLGGDQPVIPRVAFIR